MSAKTNNKQNNRRGIEILNLLGFNEDIRMRYKAGIGGTLQSFKKMIRPRHRKVWIGIVVILIFFTRWIVPSRWIYIVWSFIALFVGPILYEWAKKLDKDKPFLRIVLISIMVALGGLLSTFGWNKWTNYKEDQAILIAVATEWKIMGACIDRTNKVIQHDISDDSGNTLPYIIIPNLNETNYAITHSVTVRNDSDLKRKLTDYVMRALMFNHAYQHIMYASYASRNNKENRRNLLKLFIKEKGPLDFLSDCHKDLGDYLSRKYSNIMVLSEQQSDTKYLDSFGNLEIYSIPEDNNSLEEK